MPDTLYHISPPGTGRLPSPVSSIRLLHDTKAHISMIRIDNIFFMSVGIQNLRIDFNVEECL